MNELEIRKIAKEEFINNVMNNLDSTLIFTYIQNLEQKANNLQSKIDKAIEYIENNLLPSHSIEETDWEFEEVIFSDLSVGRIKPLIDILKEAE